MCPMSRRCRPFSYANSPSRDSRAVARSAAMVMLCLVPFYLLTRPKLIRKARSDNPHGHDVFNTLAILSPRRCSQGVGQLQGRREPWGPTVGRGPSCICVPSHRDKLSIGRTLQQGIVSLQCLTSSSAMPRSEAPTLEKTCARAFGTRFASPFSLQGCKTIPECRDASPECCSPRTLAAALQRGATHDRAPGHAWHV